VIKKGATSRTKVPSKVLAGDEFLRTFVARVAFRRQTSERVRLPLQRSTYGTRHALGMMMTSCLV
jgi:hypothetical protein